MSRKSKGRGLLRSVADVYVGRLAQWSQENASSEEIGGRDPEDLAYILKGMLHAVFTQWMCGGKGGCPADRIGLIVDVFLYGVGGANRPLAESEM
jgi:hypothetical protein